MKKQMNVPQSDAFAEKLLQREIRTTLSAEIYPKIHQKKKCLLQEQGVRLVLKFAVKSMH
ncbi:putative capsular polysaccharide synthesis enzyme [Listeria weihenstephanensis FSL R9-0317]|nr:putative capsular polysaccharide synthesis enzyme [Listeria weihenstephanensis FSL R9-0317]